MIFYKVVSTDYTDINRDIDYRGIKQGFTVSFPIYATIYLFEAIGWCHLFNNNEEYIKITTSNCLKTREFNSSLQLLKGTIVTEIQTLSNDEILDILKKEQKNHNINWADVCFSDKVRQIIIANFQDFIRSYRSDYLKEQLKIHSNK